MAARPKRSRTQQVAMWLLLGVLAAFALWFAAATLSDFWLLIIIWVNG